MREPISVTCPLGGIIGSTIERHKENRPVVLRTGLSPGDCSHSCGVGPWTFDELQSFQGSDQLKADL
jgi:hypothetical protein